jgi:hypothetical protein
MPKETTLNSIDKRTAFLLKSLINPSPLQIVLVALTISNNNARAKFCAFNTLNRSVATSTIKAAITTSLQACSKA